MTEPELPLTGKTLLVAEDDAILRETLVLEFEMQGAHVLSAPDGLKAFDLIMNEKVDAVISDIRMPGGDGTELLKRVKELNYAVPVLMFITGYADLNLIDAFDLGAETVLSKPFDLDHLLNSVKKILLPKIIRWESPSECLHHHHQIERNYLSLEDASEKKELQLGRGGMFIHMEGELPSKGSRIGLNIQFQSGAVQQIAGCATIRWVRARNDGNLPVGCGIEFDHLTRAAAEQISKLINNLKLKPYIPRS